MKKIFKKTALLLILVLLFFIYGCGFESFNSNKTQLFVGSYEGGWGLEWLNNAKSEFEKKFPDVEVVITPKKNDYEYENLKNTIQSDFNDLYITACSYYNYINDFQILDITDAVTSDLSDVGEAGKSIESKMLSSYVDFYKTNGKYYAVPFGSSIWGLNYDVDLFEEKSLYISSVNGSDVVWTNGLENSPLKSVGRDNLKNTYDDGCPVKWSEFKLLLNKMTQNNITPFIWGTQTGYTLNILLSLWADSEGVENFDKIKTLSGSFVDYQGNTVNLSQNNGYQLNKMQGKYNSLLFAKEIASNENNYAPVSGMLEYIQTQDNYIESKKFAAEGKQNRIAFILEGGHWYNENKSYIDQTNSSLYPEYAKGRKFSVMPFPSFSDNVNPTATYLESSHEYAMFVNSQTKNAELSKQFIKFLCTDDMLCATTKLSGLHRNFKYELPKEDLAELPYYYQELLKIQMSDNVKIANLRNKNDFYINKTFLKNYSWVYDGKFIDNKNKKSSLLNPFQDFKDYTDRGLTIDKYMEGTADTHKSEFGN